MTLSSRLSAISAFFLSLALFYAPLAFGCTRPEMLPPLYVLLALCITASLASFLCRGRPPKVPKTVLFCFAAVLIQGWWMTANPVLAPIIFERNLADTSLENIHRLSFASMLMTTMLLGAFVVTCDLFCDARLRRFLLLSLTAAGVLICVIGVVLKLTGEPLMRYVWQPQEIYWNDFAFYRYHGNAGAFLNLVWPLILTFTRRAYTSGAIIRTRVLWTVAALACGSALFLNASKAALVIGVLILPFPFLTALQKLDKKTLSVVALCVVMLLVGVVFASSQLAHQAAFSRMTNADEFSATFHGRVDSYQEYLDAIPAVGWFGIGPGLFQLAFPYQLSTFRNVGPGIREYAHQDFLQTTLEWGYLGTLWWTILVAGGLRRALQTYAKRELFSSRTDRHLLLACVLGVLGTLAHSLVDFPLQIASIRLFFLVLLASCWASPNVIIEPAKEERLAEKLADPQAA